MKTSLFLLFLGVISFQLRAQLYTFRNFSHREGLHTVSVRSLVQSDDGYLWIGTEGTPLVRFDGEEFKEMRVKGQESDHHIVSLQYSNDTLFFASLYKGFYAYVPKTNEYKPFLTGKDKKGDALAFIDAKLGKYLITNKNIYYHSGTKVQKVFTFENFVDIYHYKEFGGLVFLFTSEGNYVIAKTAIQPLHKILGISKEEGDQPRFGHIQRNKLALCDSTGKNWMELVFSSGRVIKRREFTMETPLEADEHIVSYHSREGQLHAVAISTKGRAYKVVDNQLRLIPNNYNQSIESATSIIVDLNGDYWFGSHSQGLYKVSLEPFTKIRLDPVYEASNISFPYLTRFRDVFISNHNGTTHVGNFDSDEFVEFPFAIRSATTMGSDYYLATNLGIKKFSRVDEQPHFEDVYFKNESTTLILAEGPYFWVGVYGKGLFRIHERTNQPVKIPMEQESYPAPQYIYSGQIGQDGKYMYFGTNDGIFYCDRKNPKLKRLDTPTGFGSYSGCSTKDVYGTVWFTMEKGLVGVTNKGEMRIIRGANYVTTTLFYTLASDRLGNLILGTNKGIGIFKVDRNGKVQGFASYDANSGFEGYETHMRSQFENDNSIYVGTVEGLFLINTDILDQLQIPIKPVIIPMYEGENFDKESPNSFRFKFRVNNPKSGRIFYKYRLVGSKSPDWRSLENAELNLIDLPSGEYRLEVRASHDGKNFSPVATYDINIPVSIGESSWTILLIVLGMAALNFFIIRYSKRTDRGSLIRTKDMAVHTRMVPVILLMGIFSAAGAHVAGPLLNDQLTLNLAPILAMTIGLITLYFMARSIVNTPREYQLNTLLIIGVLIVLAHLYYESYRSQLHPFHLVGIVLTCLIVPFFLHGIRSMVFFTSTILFFTVLLIVIVKDPVYPKPFFAIANALLIILLIFSSFIRSNSLERLIFISGIINRGTTPTIAFNSEGKIVFASENISNYIDASHEDLINMDISTLNSHIPYEGKYKSVDVVRDFTDGSTYVSPLVNGKGEIHWIEWQYRQFSDDIKVMLGQEISERMELENTYELLVQNAEDFIYRMDIHGNFLFMNDVCFDRLGYTKEELINKNSSYIVPDDFQEEVKQFYAEQFMERKISSYKEFPIQSKDGNIVWIGQHVTTIFAPGSNAYISGFIALARDITTLRRQQQLIKDQRDNITASINYAQRIQLNLLPHERYFTSAFREHFIVYKPKDIVSGDFYWMEQVGDTTVLALADCTGHGVPGSFMTLLGINLLNTVVKENRVLNPGKILDELDKKLVDILPRNGNKNSINDGMEITICTIDNASNELAYACAGSRFLVYADDSFTMLKGDNKHIGDRPPKDFTHFSTHYTQFTPEHTLYLFTDGLQDQFGGKDDKKFSFRRVLSMLERNVHLPLPDQRKNVEARIDEWIGGGEQTDDITVLTIKRKLPDHDE